MKYSLKLTIFLFIITLSWSHSLELQESALNFSAAFLYYSKFCTLTSELFFSNALLDCRNFSSFTTLDAAFEVATLNSDQVGALYLKPALPLPVDNTLRIDVLNATLLDYMVLDGFDGFSSSYSAKTAINSLIVKHSGMRFYTADGSEPLDGADVCQNPNKNSRGQNHTHNFIFNKCSILNLGKSNNYSSPICPAVFNNSKFQELTIDTSSSDAASLKFLNLASDAKLVTAVKILRISENDVHGNSSINLTAELLNVGLFEAINQLIINNLDLIAIQPIDLFKSFTSIKTLRLALTRFGRFFSRNTLEWMHSLNQNVLVDLSNIDSIKEAASAPGNLFKFEISLNSMSAYAFPDSDFCNFCLYPHARLISTRVLTFNVTVNRTCTLVWLTLYNRMFNTVINETIWTDFSQSDADFNTTVQQCKFDQLISSCSSVSSPTNGYDLKALAKNYTQFLRALVSGVSSFAPRLVEPKKLYTLISSALLINFIYKYVF